MLITDAVLDRLEQASEEIDVMTAEMRSLA
jgi:hypothetical protein